MNHRRSAISRRSWLLGTIAGCALVSGPARGDGGLDAIRNKGRKAGMEGFDESESEHYRGIGDAPKRFREQALAICEAVSADYRKHFDEKGFQLEIPKDKLTVVILRGPRSYATFEGGFVDEAIGGHYDLAENRLVTFNSQGPGANPLAPVPEKVNTFQLVHETIHQLTFNTGVLDLKADVPLCVSEGLATYGETWGPKRRGVIGAENRNRLLGLREGLAQGVGWIPFKSLLVDDKLFTEPKTQQVAYAESWIFAHKMLKEPARLARFRPYLAALRNERDPAKRVDVATAHLGDPDKLDRDLRSGP